jgi:hypothetical protein
MSNLREVSNIKLLVAWGLTILGLGLARLSWRPWDLWLRLCSHLAVSCLKELSNVHGFVLSSLLLFGYWLAPLLEQMDVFSSLGRLKWMSMQHLHPLIRDNNILVLLVYPFLTVSQLVGILHQLSNLIWIDGGTDIPEILSITLSILWKF